MKNLTAEDTENTEVLKDGGQAFPSAVLFDQAIVQHSGMTLRDWFAGQALAGIISGSAHPIFSDHGSNEGLVEESIQSAIIDGPGRPSKGSGSICEIWAWVAYYAADAMLSRRKREESK